MDDEKKAVLAVGLTAMLEVSRAKLNMSESFLAFGKEGDIDEAIAKVEAAFANLAKASEEMRVFRNMLRDDRPKRTKEKERAVRKGYGYTMYGVNDVRGLPRSERDPKELIAQIASTMKPKTIDPEGDTPKIG